MGGGSKKSTVGYWFFAGFHFALIHGIADRLTRIRVAKREAWRGLKKEGNIEINELNLFGGESLEGGIVGTVDFQNGNPSQAANSYLVSKLGPYTPAFRGFTGVVLEHVVIGTSPYPKNWEFRIQRIHIRHDGLPQWYDAKAEIRVGGFDTEQSIFIAIDKSGSMDEIVSGTTTRLDIVKEAVASVLADIDKLRIASGVVVNIAVCAWSDSASTSTKNNANTADFNSLISFVNSISANGGTDFEQPFIAANSFFDTVNNGKERTFVFMTDGEPTSPIEDATATGADLIDKDSGAYSYDNGTAVEIYGINIGVEDTQYTNQVQNTGGAIVTVDNTATELYGIFSALFGVHSAMNAVHIIRESMTDPDYGMGESENMIDDVAFKAAADKAFDEGLGLCLFYDRQGPIEDFIDLVKRHINAEVYKSRTTGLYVIKLIRDDYDPDALPVFDVSNVSGVTGFNRPAFGELVNAVTVNFWNIETGEKGTVTAQDTALLQQQGNVVQTTMDYPGLPTIELASRMAQRDQLALSAQGASGAMIAISGARELNLGDPFKLNWPEYLIDGAIMRVTGLNLGNGKNRDVRVNFAQDVFTSPISSLVSAPPVDWVDPSGDPAAMINQIAFEAPYRELVEQSSQTEVDTYLANNNQIGFVGMAGSRPSSSEINAKMNTDAGAGYDDAGLLDFCPYVMLNEDIDKMAVSFAVANELEVAFLVADTWLQVDDEIMGFVSLAAGVLTVKRGVLDTVPADHLTGSAMLFWDEYGEGDPTEYVESDVVQAKITPVTGSGILDIGSATAMEVVLSARAFRPLPPGNFTLNASYFPAESDGSLTVDWVSRNRVQQTGGALIAFPDGAVTPEAGTTYEIEISTQPAPPNEDHVFLSATGISAPYVIDAPTMLAMGEFLRVRLWAVRDGYKSLQPQEHDFINVGGYYQVFNACSVAGHVVLKTQDINYISSVAGHVILKTQDINYISSIAGHVILREQ